MEVRPPNQAPGQTVVCLHCGQKIGVVPLPEKAAIDQAEEPIRRGMAARCPLCHQVVELKGQGAKAFVPHFVPAPQRKMCPNSGKLLTTEPPPAPAAAARTPTGGKDLSAFMTRDLIRVVACEKTAGPRIEELTLEYLDKADRVRLQIEALREMLGADFRMKAYPPPLNRAHLAVWGNAAACVIAKKHPQGGCQSMSDAEVTQVLGDLGQHGRAFFE